MAAFDSSSVAFALGGLQGALPPELFDELVHRSHLVAFLVSSHLQITATLPQAVIFVHLNILRCKTISKNISKLY